MNPTQKQVTSTPPADVTPADTLRGAALYLERHGWNQSAPFDFKRDNHSPFPPACTLGAITMAVYGQPVSVEDRQRGDIAAADIWEKAVGCLVDFLWQDGRVPEFDYYGALFCSKTEIVADWNDDATQTLPDVLAVLRAAADDYDWAHATEDDLETYADACVWAERHPTREGFLAWLGTR